MDKKIFLGAKPGAMAPEIFPAKTAPALAPVVRQKCPVVGGPLVPLICKMSKVLQGCRVELYNFSVNIYLKCISCSVTIPTQTYYIRLQVCC